MLICSINNCIICTNLKVITTSLDIVYDIEIVHKSLCNNFLKNLKSLQLYLLIMNIY